MKSSHLLLNNSVAALLSWYGLMETTFAQTPVFGWAVKSGYSTYASYATGIAVDPAGNALVTGALYTSPSGGFFLDKYTPAGTTSRSIEIMTQSLTTGGDAYNPQYTSVAVDGTGNVFIVGKFGASLGGTAHFGALSIPATPTMFLAKYDTNLTRLWLATSQGNPCGNVALNVDQNGNSLVLFTANGPATLGGIPVDSAGTFLASFDAAGDCVSVRTLLTNDYYSVSVGSVSATNVLVYLPSGLPYGQDSSVASFSTNGDLLWQQQFGGSGGEEFPAVASDPAGNAYVAGQFSGDVTVGNLSLSSPGSLRSLLVAKFDAMGNPLWALQDTPPSHAFPSTIVADSSGNCFIAGSFNPDETLGTNTLHWQSDYNWPGNMFAAAVSSDGQWLWAKQSQGGLTDDSILALDPSGHLYVAGEMAYTVHFDSITLSPGAPQKAYVTRIDLPLPPSVGLAQSGTNIVLSWPTNQVGFTLQSAVDPGLSAAWVNVADVPVVVADQYVVTNAIAGTAMFYRLKK